MKRLSQVKSEMPASNRRRPSSITSLTRYSRRSAARQLALGLNALAFELSQRDRGRTPFSGNDDAGQTSPSGPPAPGIVSRSESEEVRLADPRNIAKTEDRVDDAKPGSPLIQPALAEPPLVRRKQFAGRLTRHEVEPWILAERDSRGFLNAGAIDKSDGDRVTRSMAPDRPHDIIRRQDPRAVELGDLIIDVETGSIGRRVHRGSGRDADGAVPHERHVAPPGPAWIAAPQHEPACASNVL